MARRQELNRKLTEVLGSNNVYFNPPETIKLKYPCVVYNPSGMDIRYADDKAYRNVKKYQLTVIDRNPDSNIADQIIEAFQHCSVERWFVYDELNHWVLRLFY